MQLMRNSVRPYSWGSTTAIAALLGHQPGPGPEAEVWIGAHPADPSGLDDPQGAGLLDEAISRNPFGTVGPHVFRRFGARLPFLLKILAADAPLSLQAHPSSQQAVDGFARENAAGVPMESPLRNYKDQSHKPEMICALTRFHALCGFRDAAVTHRLLAELNAPRLDGYLELLTDEQAGTGIARLFTAVLGSRRAELDLLLTDVIAACNSHLDHGEFSLEYSTAAELAGRYPHDAGVLISLLMNRVTLEPGEAVYLPAGQLHAYLSGFGVEIMANSDNVLRGGLTGKHVDVPELMTVLDFSTTKVPVIDPVTLDRSEWWYPTPSPEFRLSRIEIAGVSHPLDHPGPQILLVVDGVITATDAAGRTLGVPRGRSLWIPAAEQGASMSGHGTVFRATDGLPTAGSAAA